MKSCKVEKEIGGEKNVMSILKKKKSNVNEYMKLLNQELTPEHMFFLDVGTDTRLVGLIPMVQVHKLAGIYIKAGGIGGRTNNH